LYSGDGDLQLYLTFDKAWANVLGRLPEASVQFLASSPRTYQEANKQFEVAPNMACQAFCKADGMNDSMQALTSSLDIAHWVQLPGIMHGSCRLSVRAFNDTPMGVTVQCKWTIPDGIIDGA